MRIPRRGALVWRAAHLQLTILALAIALGTSLSAQVAPAFQVHPTALAPSASYAPAQGQQAQSDDPRVRQLAEWLRTRVAAARAADPQVPPAPVQNERREALMKLHRVAGDSLDLHFRPENGTPLVIRGTLQRRVGGPVLAGMADDAAERTARAFMGEHRGVLRIDNPDDEFRLVEKTRDELGRRHLRFEQIYRGLSVWPCELLVHLDPAGDVDLVNGTYIPTPSDVELEPTLTSADAKPAVLRAHPGLGPGRFTEPELIIHGPLDKAARLAWKLEVHLGMISAWRFVVDAKDGSILDRSSLVQDAAITGTGIDGRGVSRTLNLWESSGTYYLVDTSKSMFDATSNPPNNGRGTIEIYDAANKEVQDPQFSAGLIQSTSPATGWDEDAVGAAFGLSQTFDYYQERFQRNSLNGQGGTIRALVRYGNNVQNAFWYGTTKTMVFGYGFTREIDISGHELTHGVIDSVGNGGILEYRNQPGALNEALADIFGEMVEARYKNGQPDWLKADPFDPTDRSKLLQDYANPTSVSQMGGRPNPSKMSEFVQLSLDQDNGGVHINSSIINHCFYLLAQGMDGALGLRDAERIFYRAMTTKLQKQSQFIDMRLGCVISAEEIFGADSSQAQKTREAFDLVEIRDAPSTPPPPPLPTIEGPDSTLFLRFNPLFGLVLGRREQAFGDPASGVILMDFVAPRRISVSGDGRIAVFVTANNDLGFLLTDGSNVSFADLAGNIHAVAMSPDGTRFAVVLLNPFTATPQNEIIVVDLVTETEEPIKLLAPVADGTAQDIVEYADSMDFWPDGSGLIYDAVSRIPIAGGRSFEGWTLFSLDFASRQITTLINLNEGLDFGNPSLGNGRPYLLTHEVIDKNTGVSTIFAADLRTGQANPIATLSQAGVVGFPAYSGDDRAIIYTQLDRSVPTTVSLMRQPLKEDGITPDGPPALWLPDADFAVVYRRGSFVPQNQLPVVQITSPTSGQTFPVPSSIEVVATASDPDGSVAKVQFFLGSTLISEDTTPPYSVGLNVETAPTGGLRITARAVDNLGGEADSAPVDILFDTGDPPPITITTQPQSRTVQEGGNVSFTVAATGGRGALTYNWQRNGLDLGITGPTLQLANVPVGAAGNYTAVISDGVQTITSAPAVLTVTPGGGTSNVRLSAQRVGGFVQLTITGGNANDVFHVQGSHDLRTWNTISSHVKTGDTVTTIDPESSTLRSRFYRVAIGN